jgi:hypothetical protein
VKTIDRKKDLKDLYAPRDAGPHLVEVPDLTYLMTDGEGDPNGNPAFEAALGLLYGLSYAVRFRLKKEGLDSKVMPLEGLFCAEDPAAFTEDRRGEWKWTLMILQPAEAGLPMFDEAAVALRKKKKLPALPAWRLETLSEGLCAQVLHKGPYAAEGPTVAALHGFLRERGYGFGGRHHEVYLSDPNRAAPERMRTVIRQPLRKQ